MKKIIIAIVSVCAVAALGLTLFFVLGNNSEDVATTVNDEAEPNPAQDTDENTETLSKDVTITLNNGGELNLTQDISETAKVLRENDIYLSDNKNGFLKSNENGNLRIHKVESINNVFEKGNFISFSYNKNVSYFLGSETVPGYFYYFFTAHRKYDINHLSLFDDWNGDFSELKNYFNDENSISLYTHPMMLYRNGKTVPISEIKEKYGDEANTVINSYQANLTEYFKATKGWDDIQTKEYFCGIPMPGLKWGRKDPEVDSQAIIAAELAMMDWNTQYDE